MEILGNGRLIVDGGNGAKGSSGGEEGGGAGGIIQIISPVGNLSADSLSLRRGTNSGNTQCNDETIEAHGYYYLQGMSIQQESGVISVLISSRPVSIISGRGYFHTHIEGDSVIRCYLD